jgi:hypothetical protein
MSSEVWWVLAEVILPPGVLANGYTKAFVNVTTLADSLEMAKEKLLACMADYNWHLIDVDKASPIDETDDHGDALNDMIDRTVNNPNAIIFGTFHTYKTN